MTWKNIVSAPDEITEHYELTKYRDPIWHDVLSEISRAHYTYGQIAEDWDISNPYANW